MRSYLPAAAVVLGLLVIDIEPLVAHDASKPLAPMHGGVIVETDDHHAVEMVISGQDLVFHLTEHGDPLEVTGASFKAIIQSAAGTKVLELKADGTTLKGTLDAPPAKGSKIAVTGKDPHGEVIQARFVVE